MGNVVMGMIAEEEEEEVEVTEQQSEQESNGGTVVVSTVEEEEEEVLQCSICLDEVVVGSRERSTAMLRCGHQFHLDCIGSAFNAKGAMQCPYCRQIEMGNWIYPTGPRAAPADDWSDEDVEDFPQPEAFVPLRIRVARLSEIPSLFDGTDLSPPADFLDGQNINAEPVALSEPGTNLLAEYLAYLLPSAPPESSSTFLVVERDGQPLQIVHPVEFQRNLWEHMTHSVSPVDNNNGVAEQSRLPAGETRIGGVDSGSQQGWLLPHELYGNGAESPRSLSVPPTDRPAAVTLPEYNPFYLFPPVTSGSRSEEAAESGGGNRFHSLDQGHFGPHSPVNNEGVDWPSSSQQHPPLYAARRLFGLAGTGRAPPPENSSADDESFPDAFPRN